MNEPLAYHLPERADVGVKRLRQEPSVLRQETMGWPLASSVSSGEFYEHFQAK